RRTGATNNDLVVYYLTSGTASNGVDYVSLPGSLTIPAGRSKATLLIQPLSAPGETNREQSVIVTLQSPPPPVQGDPTYVLGKTRTAAALIVERPLPFSNPVRGGLLHVLLPVPTPDSYDVQVSSDLANWDPVGNTDSSQGEIEYVDPDTSTSDVRF